MKNVPTRLCLVGLIAPSLLALSACATPNQSPPVDPCALLAVSAYDPKLVQACPPVTAEPVAVDLEYQATPFVPRWMPVAVDAQAMTGASLGPFEFLSLHALQTARQGGDVPSVVGGISSITNIPYDNGFSPAIFLTDQGNVGIIPFPDRPQFESDAGYPPRAAIGPIRAADGSPLTQETRRDGEGLATVVVNQLSFTVASFERDHRIVLFPDDLSASGFLWQPTRELSVLGEAEILEPNGGVEALVAVANASRLLAIAEYGPRSAPTSVPYWLIDPSVSEPVQPTGELTVEDGYGVTEARLLNETIWLILRRWRTDDGTRIRLASCPVAGFVQGAPRCTIRARFDPPFAVDNFESLMISPDVDGYGWTFRLISDDNFDPAQRTLLLTLNLESER